MEHCRVFLCKTIGNCNLFHTENVIEGPGKVYEDDAHSQKDFSWPDIGLTNQNPIDIASIEHKENGIEMGLCWMPLFYGEVEPASGENCQRYAYLGFDFYFINHMNQLLDTGTQEYPYLSLQYEAFMEGEIPLLLINIANICKGYCNIVPGKMEDKLHRKSRVI